MPIPQSRLRDLLVAAQDYQTALERLLGRVELAVELDPSPGLRNVAALRLVDLLSDPTRSPAILAREEALLRTTWKRNQRREARRLRSARPDPELEEVAAEYEEWKRTNEETDQ